MSFFKKLKTNIGEEEEKEQKKSVKEKVAEKKERTDEKTKKDGSDWLKSEGQLAVDVFQTASEFCIQAPIAGVNVEDIDISVENEMLIIKGERKEPDANKEKNYFYQECYWGPFSRQIILPEETDSGRIKASLQKGILLIKLPKLNKVSKKKVNVIVND